MSDSIFIGYRIDVTGCNPIRPALSELSISDLVLEYDFSHRWLGCNCIDYVLKRRCKYRVSFLRCSLGDHYWYPHGFDIECGYSSLTGLMTDQGSIDLPEGHDGFIDEIMHSEFYGDIVRIYDGYDIGISWGIYRVPERVEVIPAEVPPDV